MKNILLLVHDDEGQEARLQVALDIARALSGHLTCVSVTPPPIMVTDFQPAAAEAALLGQAWDRETRNLERLEERLEKEDVTWNVVRAVGEPERKLRDAAGLADLIVVSSRAGQYDSDDVRHAAAALAVRSGRPVMAVPPTTRTLDLAAEALVAWDGSAEANAALRAAVPLLRHAREVALLEVNLPDGAFAAEEAATYLSRHDVRSRVIERTSDWPISETILTEARSLAAAYIVMGAYGHGRAVDMLFGGVSGGMLTKSEFPLFLAH